MRETCPKGDKPFSYPQEGIDSNTGYIGCIHPVVLILLAEALVVLSDLILL
jgi:hypothetical protein